jgi:quercetin dioxygenase-like cupin family protein
MPEQLICDPVHRSRYVFERDGENMIVDTWIEPGGALPPHLHPRQEERWSVIDGEIRIQLGKTKRVIGPRDGEMIVPPGTMHGLSSSSDREAHLRCLVFPALGLQDFLEESAAAAREGLIMRGDMPRGLRGLRWAASFLEKYRDDVVMAFPPPLVARAMVALFARRGATG